MDETYIGGKEKNKHANKRTKGNIGGTGKTAVVGLRQRSGKVIAAPIARTDTDSLNQEILANVEPGSTVYTDDHGGYRNVKNIGYKHASVNHSAGEYVRGDVSTNGIESVWALMKRGITGVYHHASKKHLARYVNEFTFRLNDGNVKRHTLDRLNSLVKTTPGARITYKKLIAK